MHAHLNIYIEELDNGAVVVSHGSKPNDYPFMGGSRNGFMTKQEAERHAVRLVRKLFREEPPKAK